MLAAQEVTAHRSPAEDAEARLQLVLETSGLGEWSWDPRSDVVTFSERAAEIFGIPPGPHMTWSEMLGLLHEEDRESARAAVDEALRSGGAYEAEYRIRRPSDGVEVWVLARGQLRLGADRQPRQMLGVVGDVSRWKRVEAELRESEARFRQMADCAPCPVWVTGAAGPIEFVNQAFCEYAGRPAQALLGDAWIDLMHPDDRAAVAAHRAAARASYAPYVFEARFRRGDGAWRRLQANSRPRFDVSGAFQGYVGLAVDVTDMREAESALRESEQRFRLIAEDAPVMLWMGDENGACLYLNKALRAFWGVPEDLAGFSWDQMLLAEDREALYSVFGKAMAAQEPFEVEARYRRADGEVRWLFTRGKPRRDAEGRFVGMIGVNVDVTASRRAESHLKLLINELNHRVKNSLATVQSIAHQTLREGVPMNTARDLLTARLLALSAAHNVLTRENWEGADLAEIAVEALRPFEAVGPSRIDTRGAQVRLAPRAAVALSMALHELATNAAKYGALSTPAGRVALAWRLEGEVLTLTWKERGGPKVEPPVRRGFGSRLLTGGLNHELGGVAELDFAPQGLTCTIRARLAPEDAA